MWFLWLNWPRSSFYPVTTPNDSKCWPIVTSSIQELGCACATWRTQNFFFRPSPSKIYFSGRSLPELGCACATWRTQIFFFRPSPSKIYFSGRSLPELGCACATWRTRIFFFRPSPSEIYFSGRSLPLQLSHTCEGHIQEPVQAVWWLWAHHELLNSHFTCLPVKSIYYRP